MLFTSQAPKEPINRGQVYINLASRWTVFPSMPHELPRVESDLPEISQEMEFQRICGVREAVVVRVEVGSDAPHLILTLADGRVIFINGHDDNYEPWQAGVAFDRIGLMVIACPGGEIALFDAEALVDST